MHQVSIDYSKCILCKTCISVCPMGVYEDEGDKIKVANELECIACMSCDPACPVNAIHVKEDMKKEQ